MRAYAVVDRLATITPLSDDAFPENDDLPLRPVEL